jgi:hypothetical protein
MQCFAQEQSLLLVYPPSDGGAEPSDNPTNKYIDNGVIVAVQVKYEAHRKDDCPHHKARDAPSSV